MFAGYSILLVVTLLFYSWPVAIATYILAGGAALFVDFRGSVKPWSLAKTGLLALYATFGPLSLIVVAQDMGFKKGSEF